MNPAASQGFTTITTRATTTFVASTMSYSTSSTILSDSLTLSKAARGQYGDRCVYAVGLVTPPTLEKDDTFYVTFQADQPLDVYIINIVAGLMMEKFGIGSSCTIPPEFSDREMFGVTSGSFTLDASTDLAPYLIWLVKKDYRYWEAAYPRVSFSIVRQSEVTTITNAYQITLTRTFDSFRTVEVPFLEANAKWLAPAVLVAIVLVLFLVFKMRMGKKHEAPTTSAS